MTLSISGGQFLVDGTVINEGTPAEGLLLNVRLVQATVDFSAEAETTNWDANANTAALIAMIDDYASYGVNCISFNLQGGNFNAGWADSSYDAGAFNSDGSLRSAHMTRVTDLIDAMLLNNIIPKVGLFYFRQDQVLADNTAVATAVDNIITALDSYKAEIIIEVANEIENATYVHTSLSEANVTAYVDEFVAAGYIASVSHQAGFLPTSGEQGDGQVLYLHANALSVTEMEDYIADAQAAFPTLPVIIDEDGDTSRTAAQAVQRMNAAVNAGASWGFHDPGGYQYWDGTNMATMSWDIASSIQIAVFDEFADLSSPITPPSGAIGYVTLDGIGDYLLTVDKAGLDITGDITLIGLLAPSDVTPPANMQVINKFPSSGSGRSYALLWRADQLLQLNISTTGTTNTHLLQSTATVPATDGEWVWVMAQLDVNNGSGGYDCRFYYSADDPDTDLGSVSWTQLGSTVTAAGTITIAAGATDLNLGRFANTGGEYTGRIGGAWVISGLGVGGTKVADPDFRDDDQGWSTPPGVDDQANSWAFNGDVSWTAPTGGFDPTNLVAVLDGADVDLTWDA